MIQVRPYHYSQADIRATLHPSGEFCQGTTQFHSILHEIVELCITGAASHNLRPIRHVTHSPPPVQQIRDVPPSKS